MLRSKTQPVGVDGRCSMEQTRSGAVLENTRNHWDPMFRFFWGQPGRRKQWRRAVKRIGGFAEVCVNFQCTFIKANHSALAGWSRLQVQGWRSPAVTARQIAVPAAWSQAQKIRWSSLCFLVSFLLESKWRPHDKWAGLSVLAFFVKESIWTYYRWLDECNNIPPTANSSCFILS